MTVAEVGAGSTVQDRLSHAATGSYVFRSTAAAERDRLVLLSKLLDPLHRRALTSAGIGSAQRCLEVGAGVGTISAWMADQVGPSGSVVATDLSLDFLDLPRPANLTVRRLDVVTDSFPENAFDIITARALLHHLPSWRDVISRLVQALKPGGRLVVVEPDAAVGTANLNHVHERFWSAWCEWGRSANVDFRVGHKIPAAFAANGLVIEAAGVNTMIENLVHYDRWSRRGRWSASVPLSGEYGLRDISIGVPVARNHEDISVLEWTLGAQEVAALHGAAEVVRQRVHSLGRL